MASEKIKWIGYNNFDHYFTYDEVETWFKEISPKTLPKMDHGKSWVYNIPAAFDIETSSFYVGENKRATMYCWSLCVNGSTLFGRRWSEFTEVIKELSVRLSTSRNKLVIYVHNLGYEFQFMRRWFKWKEVFAIKERRPVRAELENGIIFKCSYFLSNYSLAYIGENLTGRYPVEKDVGALDYSLVRHYDTPMSDTEIWYSIHDVQVVCSYIQQKIEDEDGIKSIPLTNTGYVRRYCRDFCFTNHFSDAKQIKKASARYHQIMKGMQIVSACEYDQLKLAFAGSSYPGAMVMKKFPMGRGTFLGSIPIEQLEDLISDGYCLLFTIRLTNVNPKFIYEHYISVSRCQDISKDAVINNGRVASAAYLQTTVTEQDWDIIKKNYSFDKLDIFNVRVYPADYLPRPFILSILHLFANKTSLKGVEGRETEYMVSKNMINSAYGMSVTDIVRAIYEYSTEDSCWSTSDANTEEQLTAYNKNYNRFLFYAWGVWVTAHARHNLWSAIFEFGPDYVYTDTDSIKGLNFDKHSTYFMYYNIHIHKQLSDMCKKLDIPFEMCQPKTKDGVRKMIGVWEIEDTYKTFKTIGAKRYIYEYQNGELLFTVAGVNKYTAVPYLLISFTNDEYRGDKKFEELCKLAYSRDFDKKKEAKEAKKKLIQMHNEGRLTYDLIFYMFNDRLFFPEEYTGKQTLTYIDSPFIDTCVDYLGASRLVYEQSCIHMEPQSYFMSQTFEYKRFLEGYRDASI